jgi:hypothetical protein
MVNIWPLIALLFALPAQAQTLDINVLRAQKIETGVLQPGARVLPPEEFDREYKPALIFRLKTVEEVRDRCKTPFKIGFGCAFVTKPEGVCIINLVINPVLEANGLDPAIVLRHEMGHCNGWPNDHKGARSLAEANRKGPTQANKRSPDAEAAGPGSYYARRAQELMPEACCPRRDAAASRQPPHDGIMVELFGERFPDGWSSRAPGTNTGGVELINSAAFRATFPPLGQ